LKFYKCFQRNNSSMKQKYFLMVACLVLSLYALPVLAQTTATIAGTVTDAKTGEPLIGVSVRLDSTSLGAVTNIDGFYEIKNIPPKTYNITASYVGYESQTRFFITIRSGGNPDINYKLDEATTELEGVVVRASPFEKLAETPLSIQRLSAEEIATYPGGNNDIAKVVQSLPGVGGSVGGFRNDVIIRGGAPNENVYYLDGIEIPNINHFATQGSAGGPVGLLNVSFIEGVTLTTSAFNARYDNPLSGVLQFDQRVGNNRDMRGNIRLSASELAITTEGPIFKGGKESSKTSYIASFRRSYLQFLFELIDLPIRPDYWDFQYKVTHKIDDYNELNFIGLGAIDQFSVAVPESFDADQQATLEQVPVIEQISNTTGLSWKRRFKDGTGFMQTAVSFNLLENDFFRYEDNVNQTGILFQNESRELERKLRYEQTRFFGPWTLSGGFVVQNATYENNTIDVVNGFTFNTDLNLWRYGLFMQSSRSFANERLDFSLGFRMDGNDFTTQENQLLETFSPRLSLSYDLDEAARWKLNFSSGIYYKIAPYTVLGFQDNNGNFLNQDARYTQSIHVVAGLEHLVNPSTRITIEGFYKRYNDYPVSVLDSVSLANKGGGFEVLGNEAIATVGQGRTYGLEVLYQKKFTKNFYGILAYTLFQSEFTGFDTDRYLPSVWDSRHLLTFTGGYRFENNWEISVRNRFSGQTPFVPIDQAASLANYPILINDFDNLGNVRLGAFNQLDIRIDKKWNFEKFTFNVFLDIENVLSQNLPNPPSYGLARTESGQLITPQALVEIDVDNSALLPTLGVVVDF